MKEEFTEASKVVLSLGAVGVVIGIGQLLASTERLTMRIILGRALSSAGLGASSTALLVFFPDIPPAGQFGCAALIASLGTSALERGFQRWVGK